MLDEEKTAVFSMSIEVDKKHIMEDFFENLGLSLTSGVNIFFEACVINGTIPIEISHTSVDTSDLDELAGSADNPKTARFSMRIMPIRKRQMQYICKELGMTVSQAVHMYFSACIREYGIPFRIGYPKPNAETLAAMKEVQDAKEGKTELESFDSFEDFVRRMHSLADEEDIKD